MSDKLPQRIDPFRAAEQGLELRGRVPIGQMPRLLAATVSAADDGIEVGFRFVRDEAQRPFVELDCRAILTLRCERCLGRVDFTLELRQRLALVGASPGLDEMDEDTLSVDEDGLFLRDLLEDEILLGLPLIPRHTALTECDQENIAWLARSEFDETPTPKRAANPFDVLRTLKD